MKNNSVLFLLSSAAIVLLTGSFTQAVVFGLVSFLCISVANILYIKCSGSENNVYFNLAISMVVFVVCHYLLAAYLPSIAVYLEGMLIFMTLPCVWFNHTSKGTGCTVKQVYTFLIVVLLMGLCKELLATGGLMVENPFTHEVILQFSLFENYKISLFKSLIGSLLILSCIVAFIHSKEVA